MCGAQTNIALYDILYRACMQCGKGTEKTLRQKIISNKNQENSRPPRKVLKICFLYPIIYCEFYARKKYGTRPTLSIFTNNIIQCDINSSNIGLQ